MVTEFLRHPRPSGSIFQCTLTVFAAAFALLPALWAADACTASQGVLEAFLKAQPDKCSRDAECEGYYFRADACAPAVVLARPGVSESRESRLLKLQAQVRAACGKQWGQRPACSPIPFQARCRKNRCLDASISLPPKLKLAPVPARKEGYSFAVIRRECAPWDGPAIGIHLTQSPVTSYELPIPSVSIMLWRKLPPPVNQPISLEGDELGHGNRCLRSEDCESAIAGTVTFTSYGENGAAGSYELKFSNGEMERGSFRAQWQNLLLGCG